MSWVNFEVTGLDSVEGAADHYSDPAFIDAIAAVLAVHAHDIWIDKANARLKSSRELYIDAIGAPVQIGPGEWVIPLTGENAKLARMIEFGNREWDMKPTHKGDVIPFISKGPFQKSIDPRAKSLGLPYAKTFKSLPQATAYGRLIQKLVDSGVTKGPQFKKKAKSQHANGLYEGISTISQGGYITFRTVGEDGWIYPERKGEQLTKGIGKELMRFLPEATRHALIQIGARGAYEPKPTAARRSRGKM